MLRRTLPRPARNARAPGAPPLLQGDPALRYQLTSRGRACEVFQPLPREDLEASHASINTWRRRRGSWGRASRAPNREPRCPERQNSTNALYRCGDRRYCTQYLTNGLLFCESRGGKEINRNNKPKYSPHIISGCKLPGAHRGFLFFLCKRLLEASEFASASASASASVVDSVVDSDIGARALCFCITNCAGAPDSSRCSNLYDPVRLSSSDFGTA